MSQSSDGLNLTATINWTIKKYDGEKVAGDQKKPVEVINGEDKIPCNHFLNKQEA